MKGGSTTYVRVADSGNKANFHFCPVCGATVYYTLLGHDEVVAIPIGAFADPNFPQPVFSVYEERKHAWVGLPANMEHMA